MSMKELIKEEIEFLLSIGEELPPLEEWVKETYVSELNFNNADTTSGQRIYDYGELYDIVEEVYKELEGEAVATQHCEEV